MKKANPDLDITVVERGERNSTWGFGVVFSDETLQGFLEADAPTYKAIVEQFAYWGGTDTRIHGKTINSQGEFGANYPQPGLDVDLQDFYLKAVLGDKRQACIQGYI